MHIKLHYTWGDDTGEKTCTNFGPYTYRRKECWSGACNFFFHETEVAILNLYAAPHATFSNIVDVISNALGHFHLNGPIVLVGDFNIDMLQNNGSTKELENYMCKYSLRFLMNNTVHLQNALIDHVWSNVCIPQYSMFVLDTY